LVSTREGGSEKDGVREKDEGMKAAREERCKKEQVRKVQEKGTPFCIVPRLERWTDVMREEGSGRVGEVEIAEHMHTWRRGESKWGKIGKEGGM